MGKKIIAATQPLALCHLPVKVLNIDTAYQRTIGMKLVHEIIGIFDWYAFDPLLVGKRKDESMWVVDGQTRFTVAEKMGHEEVASRVFQSNGKQHEAEVFLRANTKRAVKSFDKWRAALCAGNPETVKINDSVGKYALAVSYSGHWPNLRCVSKLRDAHRAGVLNECLTAITRCWANDPDALAEVIMGSLLVFFGHFKNASVDRCIVKWATLAPKKIFADAESAKAATGGSRYKAGALVLMSKYNSGLRRGRLEW